MKLSTALPFLLSVAASPVFVSSSKSSKSNADDCPPPTQEVSCGSTFDSGEVITLAGDVFCEENITQAVGVRDAAITVRGEGTVVDCNGFSVRQKTDSSAAAVDCDVFPSEDNATQILLMKETCDLYFVWGIKVENGATAKNCNVQQFWGGVEILNGGSVENSQASLNFRGLQVENENDNTYSNVKSSSFYNNGQAGLIVFQLKNNGGAAVHIEDVKAMNNRFGIRASGTGITIRNADATNNVFAGLDISRTFGYDDQLTDITLDGQVTLNNNANNGLVGYLGSPVGTLKVSGHLITNGNKEDGVFLGAPLPDDSTDLNVVLGDGSSSGKSGKTSSSGSITSCNNGQTVDGGGDIRNFGSGTFEGTDYTCDKTGGTGDVPVCTPCYPNCVPPQENNGVRNLMGGHNKFDEMMDVTEIEP
ncbi:hypothetical protein ACHAWC_006080 [Mediolabrus comicus]